jgi:hypothetical protein
MIYVLEKKKTLGMSISLRPYMYVLNNEVSLIQFITIHHLKNFLRKNIYIYIKA